MLSNCSGVAGKEKIVKLQLKPNNNNGSLSELRFKFLDQATATEFAVLLQAEVGDTA